jgi:hypothetical protein
MLMATVELPVQINVQVSPDTVRDMVDQHAGALMQRGRLEVARLVLKWAEAGDAATASAIKSALAEEFGFTFMQEVLMDQLVDEASPEEQRYCPRCNSEDPRLMLEGCMIFEEDTEPPHSWHTKTDLPRGLVKCSQCGSQLIDTRREIKTPGHPLYGRACENVHFHGPEEEW